MKLESFDSSYFNFRIFFGGNGFQNMFMYQTTFSTLELKRTKLLNIILDGNWKGISNSKLTQLHCAFLPGIKYFLSKLGIQFSNLSGCNRTRIRRLRTKWLWIWVPLQLCKLQISCLVPARSSLTFKQLYSVDSLWNVYFIW